MNGSILTNQGAMVALQTMKSINKNLSSVQDMISTGKRVATSRDNAAIWAISSVMESDVSSFKAVTDSLALGQSTVSVARNAAEQVKDSLIEIKSKIIAAQEENVDREKIQADVDALRSQIKSIVGASQFNGFNLLKSSTDLEVLSSLDRSSNGSTSTSTINVEAKSLDSGTAATSVAGTAIVAAVNAAGATVTAAFSTSGNTNPATVTEGAATLGTFTNSSQDFVFSTTLALDEGDSVAFSFTDGVNTATFTYTQTATGTAQTTGEELAKQLKNAYTAFAARDADGNGVDIGDGTNVGDYDATTKTYTATEGTFVVTGTGADNLNTLEMTENAGTLTVVNTRDTGVIFTVGNEVDRITSNMPDVATSGAPTALAANSTPVNFDLTAGTVGMQQDDSYAFTLRNTANSNSQTTFTVTGAALSSTELATTIHDALNAYKAGGIASTGTTSYDSGSPATSFTAGSTAGVYTAANGARITLSYTNGGGFTEANFVDAIDGTDGTLTATNGTSGIVNLTNTTGGDALAFFGDFTEGSTDSLADISVSNTNVSSTLTPSTQDFTFTTTQALDEMDSVQFSFTNGIDSMNVVYTQTAQGNSQTTGEELAAQLAAAYTAFKAGTNVGTGSAAGDFVASTNTYTSTEGTFVFSNGSTGNATNLKNMTFTEAAGVLTVENSGTAAVSLTIGAESDYTTVNLNTTANLLGLDDGGSGTAAVNLNFANIDGTGAASDSKGLQSDDSYNFIIGQDADDDATVDANDAFVTFNIAAGTSGLTRAQLADSIQRISDAYVNGEISSTATAYSGSDGNITYGGSAGVFTVNGATVSVTYNANGGGVAQGTFQTTLGGDLTVTNGASGIVNFANSDATAGYVLSGQFVQGTAQTSADVRVNGNGLTNNTGTGAIARAVGSGVNNITSGTIGEYLTVDVNNTANQVGDTLSITLAGVNELDGVAQPITYTAANGATEADIATGFAAAINTALTESGITDIIASTRTGGLIDIKNFNITTTKEVSDLSVVNELTTAAVATDSNGVAASTIAAGATNKVTFGATTPTKGDTYKITVGSKSVSYVARNGDDLNTIGRNLEGLLKLKSTDNITVNFTASDDPTTTDTVLTVKNNGTSAISAFSATVKSGGTVGGGLELIDEIDVTSSAKAEGSLDIIENLIDVAIDAASTYGSAEKRLESQQTFISKLTDSMKSGIGALVDANLEETSARLQALQVQQQLGTQALSIANQSPQSILSLFR